MSDPGDLQAFLSDCWHHLAQGVADAAAPARYPTFATVAPDGTPQARTVALRAADRAAAAVEIHTDVDTPKVAELQANPLAALHVWLPQPQMQIRLTARVSILTGAAIDAQWADVPPASRVSYGTQPAPGTPIDHVYAYEKPSLRNRFAVLRCHVTRIDLVDLAGRHRRACYAPSDGWRGTWVAP